MYLHRVPMRPRGGSGLYLSPFKRQSICHPQRQPPWCSFKEHFDVIKDEVLKLKWADAIKDVFYPEWLVNMVVVKKKSGKWWVCMDFTNLNKACSRDSFPLPQIDQLVDATAGHPRMNFLDAF